ncbi:GH24672 [Drosophila grimshawi]|uniref:GH24672 n=1 Tax=Drosophila grimshawi TaxID=7222 RepID=B4JMQ6_DROGR|nr:GH24672 [Drosophila grimshawi]
MSYRAQNNGYQLESPVIDYNMRSPWYAGRSRQQQQQQHPQNMNMLQQRRASDHTDLSWRRSHHLNVNAPSFTPASARQSQPELQTYGPCQRRSEFFETTMKLMRELNCSVSYMEIIRLLSKRLGRLPIELKRHIPHILQEAVLNGFLRKDGSYYTLLSDKEQKVIMKRNQERVKREKEHEKQPLSWRMR